jgi:hypothetical protein
MSEEYFKREVAAFRRTLAEIRALPEHDHDCCCSGRLRIDRGLLVAEVICDGCGAVVANLETAGTHAPAPS